ncbi:lytic polysaccharide monooxygenase [Spongiactinospora sp. TRM90649]|uniref:lytic polysaccharide monooxygenase n=1 Tax=Spongiactinospora sp. TRM90649 TaxID=3031114 RepID=UPI0023F90D95|nr:lytic polysaccharide monooxygenase [Spongiactinospora sp. TRM90649]MDF5752189.1 lytic polysaccharide monooxygenase [Spongiactinospora sp. TRM90649]
MRRLITFLASAAVAAATVVFIAPPASAHGYVSDPPSRQANCASGKVRNCGQIIWEPESVEGRKGQRNCSGGDARWSPLDDDSKAWPAASVGGTVNFKWFIKVRHATSTWEYYVDGTRIAVFNDGGRVPASVVNHAVNLGGRTGRIKLLAIWNIADTAMAFYNCVDLQVGPGGPEPTPTPTPTVTPTVTPTPTPTPTVTPTQGPATNWTAGTAYNAGDRAIHNGVTYRCTQAHTALPGWEPPNVPALWQRQ